MIEVLVLTNIKVHRVIKELEEYGKSYRIRNLKYQPLTYEEFKIIMSFTDSGFDDILATKGKAIDYLKEQEIQLEALSMRQAYELIVQFPSLLRLPLVTDFRTRTNSGLNAAETFIPKKMRQKALVKLLVNVDRDAREKKEKEEGVSGEV